MLSNNELNSEKAYQMFFNAIISGRIDMLVDSAYDLLKYPILVTDEIANTLSLSPKHKIGDPDWDFLIENGSSTSTHFFEFYKKYYSHPEDRKYPLLINDGYKIKKYQLVSVLSSQKKVLGHSAIVIGKNKISNDEMEIVELFNAALTTILKLLEKKNHHANIKILQLFTDIITGNNDGALFSSPQFDKFKIKYQNKYTILVSESINDVYDESLYSLVSNDIMKSNLTSLSITHNNKLITMISSINKSIYENLINNPDSSKLFNVFKKYELRTGISSAFDDLRLVKDYYQQALLTLNTGIKIDPLKKVFAFENYMPFQIFRAVDESFPSSVFIHPVLIEIFLYDEKKGTNHLETLGEYILNMMNTKKASESLHIHTNTMVYRISRIRELFSIDFNDQCLLNTLFCNFSLIKINKSILK